MAKVEFDSEELMGFFATIKRFLGIEQANTEEALQMKGGIQSLQASMEKVLMSQSQTQTDIDQIKSDQTALLSAINDWRTRVQTALDAANTAAKTAQDAAQALKDTAAAAPSGAVDPALQAAIDQNHSATQQVVQQLNSMDQTVQSAPAASSGTATGGTQPAGTGTPL